MAVSWRASPALRDLRVLAEATLAVIATWLLLGWTPARAITQVDGSQLVMPYVRGALAAGADWTQFGYRFGVLGGSDMHPFGGTMPLVQTCAALGLSTTLTCNLVTWFVQIAIAYFSLLTVESLASLWTARAVRLAAGPRVVAIWVTAFAPVLGWRVGVGHENLLLGLLPYLAALALALAAGAGRVTGTALAFAAFAVANGVSGLGAQTVVYGALFGAPIVVAALFVAPRGARWSRAHTHAVLALAAGVLTMVPRIAPMIAHATGDDATRGLGESAVYSYSTSAAGDWLASVPWTSSPAVGEHTFFLAHEYNFPAGPLLILLVGLWPRGRSRALLWAALASACAAIVLADHVSPLAEWLLAALPPLRAFRVPARAILPVAVVLPALALAAWTAATAARTDAGDDVDGRGRRAAWVGVLGGALVIALGGAAPTWAREVVAWVGCIGAVVVARRGAPSLARILAATLAPIAALGVVAFHERIPADIPLDTVEDGPARIHDAVLAQLPDTADPLVRVELPAAPMPFRVSAAWAAGLSSLDGLFYPPRRFLDLMAALLAHPVSPMTCMFDMTRSRAFPVYQQLYDVVAEVELTAAGGDLVAMPAAPGPAWFPTTLTEVPDDAAVGAALRAADAARAIHATVQTTAWLVRDEPVASPIRAADPACAQARVLAAHGAFDAAAVTIDVATPADCVLVVSANYVSTLRATSGGASLAIFPIDVALIGVAVPRGTATVTIAAEMPIPSWATALGALGALALLGALADHARRRAPVAPTPAG